jgi:ABC-type amino acid transport substrate-binding protein
MRTIERWRWLVIALTLVALLGAACGGGEEGGEETGGGGGEAEVEQFPASTSLGKIQEKGEITIGVKYDVPPFGFKNPQTGDIEGFDVDLGTIVAERLGVEPNFIEAISDNRIPFLQDGTADLILSTMTITTDRDAEIDFSNPYYIAHGRIAVYEGSDVQDASDLAGTRVCTALDSTYQTTIIPKVAPKAKIEAVDAYSDCVELLQNGAVDAEVTDDIILAGQKAQDDKIELVGDDLTDDPYGAGMPEGDKEMQDFVNEVLADIFESGEWQEIYDKWVGEVTGEEADDPQEWTLEDALKNYPCSETC